MAAEGPGVRSASRSMHGGHNALLRASSISTPPTYSLPLARLAAPPLSVTTAVLPPGTTRASLYWKRATQKKIFRRRIRGQLCFPRLGASGRSAGICCIYHTSSLDIARRSFGCGFPARARGVALSAARARQLCCPCVIDSCVYYKSPRGG